jgi:transcriptional regulator with XRE-family HTH domain
MLAMVRFDGPALFASLDSARQARGLSWAQLSQQTGVSVSTIKRSQGGGRMEVDGVLALTSWLGRPVEDFLKRTPF